MSSEIHNAAQAVLTQSDRLTCRALIGVLLNTPVHEPIKRDAVMGGLTALESAVFSKEWVEAKNLAALNSLVFPPTEEGI